MANERDKRPTDRWGVRATDVAREPVVANDAARVPVVKSDATHGRQHPAIRSA